MRGTCVCIKNIKLGDIRNVNFYNFESGFKYKYDNIGKYTLLSSGSESGALYVIIIDVSITDFDNYFMDIKDYREFKINQIIYA